MLRSPPHLPSLVSHSCLAAASNPTFACAHTRDLHAPTRKRTHAHARTRTHPPAGMHAPHRPRPQRTQGNHLPRAQSSPSPPPRPHLREGTIDITASAPLMEPVCGARSLLAAWRAFSPTTRALHGRTAHRRPPESRGCDRPHARWYSREAPALPQLHPYQTASCSCSRRCRLKPILYGHVHLPPTSSPWYPDRPTPALPYSSRWDWTVDTTHAYTRHLETPSSSLHRCSIPSLSGLLPVSTTASGRPNDSPPFTTTF
ncbi:hypothetical protein DFH27DRAFT_193845 [Peziza echinospora]|nr:hypothetical protein DFH27DRAFT_193845 [Peziza echinospora]